ncbi:type II secretion system minor pseudopilin GspK [Porticoccaceae bacterium]|nr:type II secretion system minor pseudopilin GspK [Porticoccaceae bacterium]
MIKRNTGVALLSMLLVLGLVTTITANMLYRNTLEIKRQQTLLSQSQLRQTMLAALSLVEIWLQKDQLKPQLKDQQQTFKPDRGTLDIAITNETGKFNINNVVNPSGKLNPLQLQSFQRLLSLLKLDPALANNLADWIDSDSHSSGQNSEDLGYSIVSNTSPQGYRAANRPVTNLTELLLIKGYTRQVFDRLQPYITALPITTALNINTASATVLEAVIPAMVGSQIVTARSDLPSGFISIEDFLKHPVTAGSEIPADQLTTTGAYYLLTLRASHAGQQSTWQSLLSRKKRDQPSLTAPNLWQVNTIWREQLPFWQPTPTLITYE